MIDDVEWMEPEDEKILELMQRPEHFTPTHIDAEGVCRGPHAAYRCRELTEHGLLEKQAIGMYDITDLGERFLDGELEPSDLEPDDAEAEADDD
ncbi:hypothetical protein [Halopiger djelfimassiliensis]|uniref:hypothetical protein n=1 Tax=Halopiger djelfimassiliensis TaxID=1293047 RepID=UPI00067798BF|nr:hypothetical protein [Halopiger djelfimassiliensis]